MDDAIRLLPVAVSEFTSGYPAVPPARFMDAVELPEECREQVAHDCAVARYLLHGSDERCEIPTGVRPTTVEWADVAEWDVADPEGTQ